jgi:uncharacterized protein YjbI with pentapeptide repeats
LRNCDLTGAKYKETVFVEAKLQNAKLSSLENQSVYLKFAKME